VKRRRRKTSARSQRSSRPKRRRRTLRRRQSDSGKEEPMREEEPGCLTKTFPSPIPGQSFQVMESVQWPGAFSLCDGRKACSF
jgi:hypothetical protein